ncbi:MAG: nucleotide exchange factor GrpE [Candidatus Saccharibacteria bacterium]|nr:nucleotide exchange factor GrpE [Candidatus Saccharibacteria bacterium]
MFKKQGNQNMQPENPETAQEAPKTDKNLEKIAELTNDLQRTRADFENFRKQVEIREQNAKNMSKLATVSKILPLLDDLDRAISTYEELKPLEKSLEKTLSELKLAKIEAIPEKTEFNPDLHDAISMDDSEGEKEVISEVLRPGYYYENEVLRPTMVKVTRK